MPIEIRTPAGEHLDEIFNVRAQAFAVEESDRERWTNLVDPARGLAAFEGTTVVGFLNILDFGQWFGGRSVPMGGLATVVVRSEHRGRGVAAQLLAASVEKMRERGLVVSTLHPATTRVYRAAGWEIAGDHVLREVPARSLDRLPRGDPGRLRRLAPAQWPAVRQCYEAVSPAHTGWLDRSEWWWDLYREESFDDLGFVYGVEGDNGALDGYVSYHQKQHDGWGYRIDVEELVAVDAAAATTLWRFLGGHGMQVEKIRVQGGTLDALTLLLPEQDVRTIANLRWMSRVVDAPAAIAARGFRSQVRAEVHLGVADPVAPWNDGLWMLTVEDGTGMLQRGGDGDVHITIQGLAALYTGFASTAVLRESGLLTASATATADLSALDACFAGPPPSIADEF